MLFWFLLDGVGVSGFVFCQLVVWYCDLVALANCGYWLFELVAVWHDCGYGFVGYVVLICRFVVVVMMLRCTGCLLLVAEGWVFVVV